MIYQIPIIYQRIEYKDVEADNLQDAVKQALEQFLSEPDEYYLEDSFELDSIIEENYDEHYDVNKALADMYKDKTTNNENNNNNP